MALNPPAALVAAAMALALAVSSQLMAAADAAVASARPRPIGLPGCDTKCGNVNVPYPFGFGPEHCYWKGLNLTCDRSGHGGEPRLLLGDGTLRVAEISLKNATVRVIRTGSIMNRSTIVHDANVSFVDSFAGHGYWLSPSSNELVLTGCNVMAMLVGDGDGKPGSVSGGCVSFCSDREAALGDVTGRTTGKYCAGTYCCQVPLEISPYSAPKELQVRWLNGWNNSEDLVPVPAYVFVAEEGWFDHRPVALDLISYGTEHVPSKASLEVPIVLRWAVVEDLPPPDWSKDQCAPSVASELCKSNNSKCGMTQDTVNDKGYVCKCKKGYDGNPYVAGDGGCQDINECDRPQDHGCFGDCINTDGDFICQCPPGTQGNHSVPRGCMGIPQARRTPKGLIIAIAVGSATGSVFLFLGVIFLIRRFKHMREINLKEKYFKQNRGQLLQQLVSHNADIAERMIIPMDELAKATNNFDKARELGGGGHGTVYKGILSDQHVVAIKKPNTTVRKEIEEFINEVAILSQINHRNVVKLFGCCLETEVPLLVYEFISNGTLYHHLHVEEPRSLPWVSRLRIATEISSALAYLHSSVSTQIIHRDIKTTNILLDDTLTSKVADFGASRYIPIDKTGLTTTKIQGTRGYIDPMCYYTGRLTEKSDVYSFGVILVELLTRKKPSSYLSSDGDCLVFHFVNLLGEENLGQILDPQVIEEGGKEVEEVAVLAASCIKLTGEERPTMQQVELALKSLEVAKKDMLTEKTDQENGIGVMACWSAERGQRMEESSRRYSLEQEFLLSARYPR